MVVYRNQRKPATAVRPAVKKELSHPEVEPIVNVSPAPKFERPHTPAVPTVHVLDHPLAAHALTALRDQRTTAGQFRHFSNQLLRMLAWEATRLSPLSEIAIETEHGPFSGRRLSRPFVFLSLSKSVLGISYHVAEFLPNAAIGTVIVDKDGGSDGRIHLSQAPALCDAHVLLFDPVIGTARASVSAIKLLKRSGAASLSVLTFVTSAEGLQRIKDECPEAVVHTAAVDAQLDPKTGPIPGLGNVGERLFS